MTDVQAEPGGVMDPTKGPGPSIDHSDDDMDDGGGKGGKAKSRRELPAGAVAILKAWLLSPEHFTHPYPTPQDQLILMQKTGIDKKQLKNWFTNARRRIWKPMLKKQLEQGKLQATGAGGVVAIPGTMPGMIVPPPASLPGVIPSAPVAPLSAGQEYLSSPASTAASIGAAAPPPELHAHYQHALQQQHQQQPQQSDTLRMTQQQGYDVYGQPQYSQQQQAPQQETHPGAPVAATQQGQYSSSPYYTTQPPFGQAQHSQNQGSGVPGTAISQSNSLGSLPPITASSGSSGNMMAMNKTDSHAVLMELFARDQDLVRQATEGARLKAQAAAAVAGSSSGTSPDMTQQQQFQHHASTGGGLGSQHPMKMVAQGTKIGSVPSLNSWPAFSSVSSLNNLGTMTGVKSITNMSEADLARQGNLNKKGNLAQVKSIESMGRADSYAFLEVFFDNASASGASQGPTFPRGVKREREEDNDIGLSLDADESPYAGGGSVKLGEASNTMPVPTPLPGSDKGCKSDGGTLKRAYDDALAARGLISVSRSCEKLTDLALPAKMQRTLSQQYLHHQMQSITNPGPSYTSYGYSNVVESQSSGPSQTQDQIGETYQPPSNDSQQYPGQNPGQQHAVAPSQASHQQYQISFDGNAVTPIAPLSDPSMPGASVEVPASTKCSICHCINVDTQLRPCGHMFHGRCLKPSLQNAVGPPQCPIDHIAMQSAVLAVPTDDNASNSNQHQQQHTGTTGMISYHSNTSNQALSSEPENASS